MKVEQPKDCVEASAVVRVRLLGTSISVRATMPPDPHAQDIGVSGSTAGSETALYSDALDARHVTRPKFGCMKLKTRAMRFSMYSATHDTVDNIDSLARLRVA